MRTKIILVIAIIMGLITTMLFYKYMMRFDQETIVNESLVEVAVAVKEIPKNQRIGSDVIGVVSVSEESIHQQALKNPSEIIGKFATSRIAEGEQILSHRIAEEKDESLFISRKVKEGYRGVSIGVNFVQSVSNLIEPEDWVDVVFTEISEDADDVESEILLSKVKVLAVGRKMVESTAESVHVEYSSATLELTSEDSVKLVNASQRGSIHLVVHSRIQDREGMGGAE